MPHDLPANGVTLRLLGDPALLVGAEVKALERRAAGLLALVALQPGITRARAAQLLWPDSDNARQALRQQLARFRKNYGVELIEGADALNLVDGMTVDVLQAAGGVLLGTLGFDDCEDFSDWLEQQRARRRGGRTAELARKLAEAEAQGDLHAAVGFAEQLRLADNDSEAHHRTLMRLHYLRGDIAQAQRAYAALRTMLQQRFSAAPSAETEALVRVLRSAQEAAPTRAASAAPARSLPITVLRPPRLVGRERELAAARASLETGRVLLVLGEAGLGKSRLLDELMHDQPRAVRVKARPGDAVVPFATLTRLLRAVLPADAPPPPAIAADPASLAVLARFDPPSTAPAPLRPQADRLDLQRALERVLTAANRPQLIIDDLHFADPASCELLHALAAGPALAGVSWVLAQRPGEGAPAAAALHEALVEAGQLVELRLNPLDEDALAALVDSLALPELDGARLAPLLARHTGGNPLFALETLRQGLAAGQSFDALSLPRPGGVQALIQRRLHQLSERALKLARVAAVAGVDFDIAVAEHLMGVRAIAIASAWAELESAQILRGAAFAHDLVSEATLADLPRPIAAALHAGCAEVLEVRGAEPARLAHHWVAAGRPERAVPMLEAAEQRALALGRMREAADFAQSAFEALIALGRVQPAFSCGMRLLQLLGEFDLDERHALLLQRLRDLAQNQAQLAEVEIGQSNRASLQGDYKAGLQHAQAALAYLRPQDRAVLFVEAAIAAAICLRYLFRLEEARDLLQQAAARGGHDESVPADLLRHVHANLVTVLTDLDLNAEAAALHESHLAHLQCNAADRARMLGNYAGALEELGCARQAYEVRASGLRLLLDAPDADRARRGAYLSLAYSMRQLQRYAEAFDWLHQLDELAPSVASFRPFERHAQYAALYIDLAGWRAADAELEGIDKSDPSAQQAPYALFLRARYALRRGLDPRPQLHRLEAILAGGAHRRAMRRLLMLRMKLLPPAEALALAQAELGGAQQRPNPAWVLPMLVAAAQACLRLQQPERALPYVERANQLADTVVALELSPFETVATRLAVLAALGDARTAAAVTELAGAIEALAAAHVPQALRMGFRLNHPLHGRLIDWARRPGGLPPSGLLDF